MGAHFNKDRMDNSIEVSIIIPVYNSEKYIAECLDSILKQEEIRKEIILVDDGSTDSSGAICDRYAHDFNFISVLHNLNSGPATAKNAGYRKAKGRYISFIDSDDKLVPEMFSCMLGSAETHQADIVCCSYLQVDEQGNFSHQKHSGKEYVYSQEEGVRHLLDKDMIYSQCWTKIYRKEMLDRWNIKFVDGMSTEEDFIYNLQAFMCSRVITVVDKPLYIYTHRLSSLSRAYFQSHLGRFLQNMTYRLELTDTSVKQKYPSLNETCTLHCLFYYNLMIGRAAMFTYDDCIPYYRSAFSYMRKNILLLVRKHARCGLSLCGAALFICLPPKLYFLYRHKKSL